MIGRVGVYVGDSCVAACGSESNPVGPRERHMAFWTNKQQPTPETTETTGASTSPEPSPPPPPAPRNEEPYPMAMMKRDELPSTLGGTSDLLLGAGAEFEGKLTFKGTVRIDAKFKGSIVTNDVLIVGEHAKIDAEITCGTVVVHGEVNGNIKAKTAVELHQPARVRGNIETPSLMIEKGVFVQGELKMEESEKGSSRSSAARDIAAVQ